MKTIYIVIPVFNHAEETTRCLGEVEKLSVPNYKLVTVVVDNGSKDDTVKLIKKQFRGVKLIENKTNLGFGTAVNKGLRLALKDKDMAMVLILNNDTSLNNKFLPRLIKTLKSNPKYGMAAPALQHFIEDKRFFGMEGKLDLKTGKARHRNITKIKSDKIIQADFVSAACVLVKREVLEKGVLFDEQYFLYLEDVDFCLQAKHIGYKSVLNPNAVIRHETSASLSSPLQKIPYSFRSNLRLIRKWTPLIYKPSALIYCCIFYPYLAGLWSLHGLKHRLENRT